MSFEEADVLRERAEAFLRNAKHLIEVGEHDLAAFSAEQPFQLLLKYKLLLKTGTYPRTHSLTRLLRVAKVIYALWVHPEALEERMIQGIWLNIPNKKLTSLAG